VLLSAAAVAAALLALAAATAWRRQRAPRLPTTTAEPPATVAILPMRDEAANVDGCLDAVLAQSATPPVVVVDDGSRDGTAERARRPGVRVLSAPPTPSGWRGKVNALATGAAATEEPWLLLVDADARPAPHALARAHAAAAERGLAAISLAGYPVARGLGENLLVPSVFAVLDSLLGDWHAAADGGPAVASGQFVLVRRSALEAAGGFAAIRTATIDDVALMLALRAAGFRTGFWRAPDLLCARMYRGWRDAHLGWRRNLAAIFDDRPAAATLAFAGLAGPPLAALALLGAGEQLGAAVIWAGGVAASALFRISAGNSPGWALLYPADAVALTLTLARSIVDRRLRRLPSWKGREIRL
jgi:glycosyltransferase involved in cell wall biosynthesis